MSRYDYYYVQDSGEPTCATCALEDAKRLWEQDDSDAARRLLALIRLDQPNDIDDMYCYAQDRFSESIRYRYCGNDRDRNAWQLLTDTVAGIVEHGQASGWGESCGGCCTELVEPYVVCEYCGNGNWESHFDSAGNAWGDGGENPTVPYCGSCEDNYLSRDKITEDDRGYRLWFSENYRDMGPIYGAGCRRFTLEQALQHWSDPTHYDPESAAQLFDGVIRHATERALRMIARANVR